MITTILTSYKRQDYLQEQIDSIKNQTQKSSEIWIWHNTPDGEGPVDLNTEFGSQCKIINSNNNFSFFGRFALATLAQTEYIAMFDDDTIPAPKWFELCLETINEVGDGILGGAGVILHSNQAYSPHNKVGWNGAKPRHTKEVDLVGHAWFFKKSSLKYFFMEEPHSWDNAEDMHFSAMAQKYGSLKTYVPAIGKDMSSYNPSIKGQVYGSDGVASWKYKRGHFSIRNMVASKLCANGWSNPWRS